MKVMKALEKKYEAEIAAAKANLDIYDRNPAGIGDHPDIVSAVDSEIKKLADAEDKLSAVKKHFLNNKQEKLFE